MRMIKVPEVSSYSLDIAEAGRQTGYNGAYQWQLLLR